MHSRLTASALNELTTLLTNSRRHLGEIYRSYSHGLTAAEIAEEKGLADPRKIEDSMNALLVLFGRKPLPKRAAGRQKALSEAEHWLNSNTAISQELEEHFNKILFLGKRTNTRKTYAPEPVIERIIPKRRPNGADGREAGVYILTRREYLADFEAGRSKKLLVKLGYSDSVWERISSAQTWDPEPLAILRVYLVENPKPVEVKFHVVLDTLNQQYKLGGGSEWFATELPLIDAIAKALELKDCSEDEEPH